LAKDNNSSCIAQNLFHWWLRGREIIGGCMLYTGQPWMSKCWNMNRFRIPESLTMIFILEVHLRNRSCTSNILYTYIYTYICMYIYLFNLYIREHLGKYMKISICICVHIYTTIQKTISHFGSIAEISMSSQSPLVISVSVFISWSKEMLYPWGGKS
jgi:hypothetical protein